MKKLIIILFISCFGSILQAQPDRRPKLTPEEFRTKQEAYITQKAELSKEEASKFFPIFFELQTKKRELNDKAWEAIREGKKPETTESQYEEIINKVLDTRIQVDELEKEYYKKFKSLLSAKKIYKLQHAEMRFHRELLKDVNKGNKTGKKM